MRVGILGPLEVTAGGESVEIGGARLRVLLVRLAVGVGRVVTVEELADALWPQERPAIRRGSGCGFGCEVRTDTAAVDRDLGGSDPWGRPRVWERPPAS
ncbi:hypothetical protein FHR32_005366 [Streptosporangium album]|uniref:OmpR/PhoB-type domain-containing protein n=1 Tax=Streptosporangium album TaxID=47479 RepID=A0A7W7RZ80_9ACTN|nr:hypothetical protein [Streptosporangium album]MBB4940989.1 hypothetical protein [Streptosporangium album]